MGERPREDELAVRNPCDQSWADMPGDHRQRFCDVCRRHVLNVEHFTRAELRARMAEGRVCRRIRHRPDGTIITADRLRRPGATPGAVTLSLLLAACGPDAEESPAATESSEPRLPPPPPASAWPALEPLPSATAEAAVPVGSRWTRPAKGSPAEVAPTKPPPKVVRRRRENPFYDIGF